jgi:hypothetical protein
MGGLLWLAFQGHVWARDFVQAAWPLFILTAGFCTVMIVTDRDALAGKIGIVAGVAILFMARLGIMPEATLLTLAPWALIVTGAVIALSGLGLRVRPAAERPTIRMEDGLRGTMRERERCLHHPFGHGTSGRRAQAS